MALLTSVTQAFEGVGIAFDSLRANKIRAALTIMGVALGVFVVVAMSSVVKGINESFRRDLESRPPVGHALARIAVRLADPRFHPAKFVATPSRWRTRCQGSSGTSDDAGGSV